MINTLKFKLHAHISYCTCADYNRIYNIVFNSGRRKCRYFVVTDCNNIYIYIKLDLCVYKIRLDILYN